MKSPEVSYFKPSQNKFYYMENEIFLLLDISLFCLWLSELFFVVCFCVFFFPFSALNSVLHHPFFSLYCRKHK